MEATKNIILKSICYFLYFLILFSLTGITILNIAETTYLINWEHSVFVKDNIWGKLVYILTIIVIIFLIKKYDINIQILNILKNEKLRKKIYNIELFTIFILSLLWCLSTQFIPGVDEGEILNYVYKAKNGDWDVFKPGNYMNFYPHQFGLFLFEYVLANIVGCQNYVFFQIVNCFCLVIIYDRISKIAELLSGENFISIFLLFFSIFFIPPIIYCQMIYGNIIGICFVFIGIKEFIDFYHKKKSIKIVTIILSLGLAVFFKETMLIYICAVLIISILLFIFKKIKEYLLIILGIIFIILSLNTINNFLFKELSGYSYSDRISSLSFIAMGLQRSELAPGWWNGYNTDSFHESNNNNSIQRKKSILNILENLKKFKNDPKTAFDFFYKKAASTWSNPTFQCFGTVRNGAYVILPQWADYLLRYSGQKFISVYLDFLNIFIYLGAILFILSEFSKKVNLLELLLPLSFLGGAIFLLIWETKARYALMFYFSIIPISFIGYKNLVSGIFNLNYSKKNLFVFSEFIVSIMIYICIILKFNPIYLQIIEDGTIEYNNFYIKNKDKCSEYIYYGFYK